MPKYTVKDNNTGKTITFDWQDANPPTDTDMEEIFAQAKVFKPDSIKTQPAQADITAVQRFKPPQMQDNRLGLFETAKMFMPISTGNFPPIAAGLFEPKEKQAGAVRNVIEYGLPFLAAPLTGFASIPAAGSLAGIGNVLGQQTEDLMLGQRTPNQELIQQGLLSTAVGMGGQAAGLGATKMLGKGLAPFAKSYQPETEALAKQYGIETTASMVNKGRAVPLIESLSGKGIFGDKLRVITEKAEQKIATEADNLVKKIGNADPVEAGIAVNRGIKNTEDVFYQTKEELYNAAQIKKGDLAVNPTETIKVLDETIARLEDVFGKKPPILYKLKKLRTDLDPSSKLTDQLRRQGYDEATINRVMNQPVPQFKNTNEAIEFGKKATPQQIEQLRLKREQALAEVTPLIKTNKNLAIQKATEAQFYREAIESSTQSGVDGLTVRNTIQSLKKDINFADKNPVTQGYQADLRKISVTLSEEFDSSLKQARPELSEALDKANSFYKENINKLNTGYGRKIQQLAQSGQYDKISQSILNKNTSVNDISKIFEVVGDDAKQMLKAELLERLIGESKRNANQVFTPTMLDRTIKTFGEKKLAAIYTLEELKTLKELSKIASAIGQGQKVSEGSQTTFLARLSGEVALSFIDPVMAVKLFLGDAAVSKLISSRIGQQWLKGGFKLPQTLQYAIPSATRVAGQRLGAQ